MSTDAVSSDMVATYQAPTLAVQRPTEPFDPTRKWCWRNGSSGGEEWHKAVVEAAEANGLTEALFNPAPKLN